MKFGLFPTRKVSIIVMMMNKESGNSADEELTKASPEVDDSSDNSQPSTPALISDGFIEIIVGGGRVFVIVVGDAFIFGNLLNVDDLSVGGFDVVISVLIVVDDDVSAVAHNVVVSVVVALIHEGSA